MYQLEICIILLALILFVLSFIAYISKCQFEYAVKGNGRPLRGKDYLYTLRQHYPKATELYEDTILWIIGHKGLQALIDDNIIKVKENNVKTLYRLTDIDWF
jgi:hypothetical protein